MTENSKIEWTDHTFNPWWGCVKVSAGCKNCYAEKLSNRFGQWFGLDNERRFFSDKHWAEPLKWNRKAKREGKRYKVFCGSMCDVFEDNESLEGEQTRLIELIAQTENLDWLLLTKRPENVIYVFATATAGYLAPIYFDNVWLGASVENQKQADQRIPELLTIPAKVRFLSCEPLLGPVDLGDYLSPDISHESHGALTGESSIDWVIVGGESGPNRRSMNLEWARTVRDQCKDACVPFFFKQVDKVQPIPDDLMIREYPNND